VAPDLGERVAPFEVSPRVLQDHELAQHVVVGVPRLLEPLQLRQRLEAQAQRTFGARALRGEELVDREQRFLRLPGELHRLHAVEDIARRPLRAMLEQVSVEQLFVMASDRQQQLRLSHQRLVEEIQLEVQEPLVVLQRTLEVLAAPAHLAAPPESPRVIGVQREDPVEGRLGLLQLAPAREFVARHQSRVDFGRTDDLPLRRSSRAPAADEEREGESEQRVFVHVWIRCRAWEARPGWIAGPGGVPPTLERELHSGWRA